MRINQLVAEGVSGHLKFDINFFDSVTFLTGINGSGKTSALHLIKALVNPSYDYMCAVDFDYAKVVCSTNASERDIIIEAKKIKGADDLVDSRKINFSITKKDSEPIQRNIILFNLQRIYENTPESDEKHFEYSRRRIVFDRCEPAEKIRELASPVFLGLNRKIIEGQNLIRGRGKYLSNSNIKSVSLDESARIVQRLLYNFIRKIADQQPQYSEDFRNKIFSNSFRYIENTDRFLTIAEIEKKVSAVTTKKEYIYEAMDKLGIKGFQHSFDDFFERIEKLMNGILSDTKKSKNTKKAPRKVRKDSKSDSNVIGDLERRMLLAQEFWVNSYQIDRIDLMINDIEEYQEKIQQLRAPIKKFENIVNSFYSENGKKLIVEGDGDIAIYLPNESRISFFDISSGEKQILIMMANLIFQEDFEDNGIFIIDEPEVSLHLSWQQLFVKSIREASPDTQFILATHSPAIIASNENEKYCQDLSLSLKK